jgi:hypothetical protein
MVLELGDNAWVKNEAHNISCDVEFKTKVRLAMVSGRPRGGADPAVWARVSFLGHTTPYTERFSTKVKRLGTSRAIGVT